MIFADIIVDISHEKLDRSFQYIVPSDMEDKINVGMVVKIPFGRGNRLIQGFVINLVTEPSWEIGKMKEIYGIDEKKVPLESELIRLAWFIREQYGSTMNQALKTVIPVSRKTKEIEQRQVSLAASFQEPEMYRELVSQYEKKRAVAKLRVLQTLKEKPCINDRELIHGSHVTQALLKDMENQGVIVIQRMKQYRNALKFLDDYEEDSSSDSHLPPLNEEQKRVVEEIRNSSQSVHLIHGITGSGKTRVYIELIRNITAQGKQAIVMIPEISLTYQTVKRFFDVFGERVSMIHSKLSAGERYDQFERAKNGELDIMIGPRSAVFTPFSKIGIIIIDEEHEASYKSDAVPKYHARETAIYRAGLHGAKVILGSATPSVDAYYKAMQGEYMLHRMTKRASGSLAQVIVTDLRKELEEGNKTIFGRELGNAILDRLQKKEQIMLFINRRGYAGFVSCRACGEAIRCPHCDVSLTYHTDGSLRCHYCGHQTFMPKVCPSCGSKYIAQFGTGTQKVEEMVHKYYPSARVLRMDADTTAKKGGHEKIIKAFGRHEADILIGTQMIVKGHDFPLVTLVGVIAADLSLYAPDYRASERTYQLLTQAEGRAGRKHEGGLAVIQTYNPENFSIRAAAAQDYETFYEKEILYRTLMAYPPVVRMMAILVTSPDEKQGMALCRKMADWIEQENREYVVIGPADAAIARMKDIYRKVLYVKHTEEQAVISLKNRLEERLNQIETGNTEVFFDLNPMNGY